MPNFNDLIKKHSNRFNKQEPKKIQRTGPRRPWQESLQDKQEPTIKIMDDHLKAQESPTNQSENNPLESNQQQGLNSIKDILETQIISEQNENSSVTVTELNDVNIKSNSELFRNNIGTVNDIVTDSSTLNNLLRNNSVTITEQKGMSINNVTEQLRNCSVTKTRPGEIESKENVTNNKLDQESIDIQNDKESIHSSSVTVPELNKKKVSNSELNRNGLGTSTGTVTEQINIYSLPKYEEKILSSLVGICVNSGKTITPKMSYEKLSVSSGVPLESCKTLVKRLEKKGFLKRLDYRRGPSAWVIFEIPISTYQAFLTYAHSTISVSINETSSNNFGTSRGTGLRTSDSSSSSNNNINTTTKNNDEKSSDIVPELLNETWKDILIPDTLKKHGFTLTHAKQILSDKANTLSSEEIQESFDNFAIDLENNVLKIQTYPVQFFMGVVRKNRTMYESRFIAEKLQQDIENHLNYQKQNQELLKNKALSDLMDKFQKWVSKLSQEEKNHLAPPNNLIEEGSAAQEIMLRSHFMKQAGVDL